MALRSWPFLLLVLVMVGLRESCFGTSSHTLKYFYTGISEPSQGLPLFVSVGYVDDQVFVHYDSNSRRMQPRVSWIEKYVGKEDPKYWKTESGASFVQEQVSRQGLESLRNRYNQSEGLHTWQRMYGCELRRDGSKGGFLKYGYEGKTFITFDKETLTWEAPNPQAQITKRKWDADTVSNKKDKAYLEEKCIEWLEKYLSYGNETLQRTEPPGVTVRVKTEVEDGMETHVCRLDGFYPRDIDASWTRDGEVWLEETSHGSVVPNADGTYHYCLSIRIDPKERGRYRCHVEHDGLPEPLDLALEEPTNSKSNLGLFIGCVLAALVLVGVIAGILVFFMKSQDYKNFILAVKHQHYYKAAPTSDSGCNSSGRGRDMDSNRSDQNSTHFGLEVRAPGETRSSSPTLGMKAGRVSQNSVSLH